MNENEFTITPAMKLGYFGVMAALAGFSWVLFHVILRQPLTTSDDYADLVAVRIDPSVNTQSLALMRAGREITEHELTNFNLYIEDTESSDTNTLNLIKYVPVRK